MLLERQLSGGQGDTVGESERESERVRERAREREGERERELQSAGNLIKAVPTQQRQWSPETITATQTLLITMYFVLFFPFQNVNSRHGNEGLQGPSSLEEL